MPTAGMTKNCSPWKILKANCPAEQLLLPAYISTAHSKTAIFTSSQNKTFNLLLNCQAPPNCNFCKLFALIQDLLVHESSWLAWAISLTVGVSSLNEFFIWTKPFTFKNIFKHLYLRLDYLAPIPWNKNCSANFDIFTWVLDEKILRWLMACDFKSGLNAQLSSRIQMATYSNLDSDIDDVRFTI